MSSLDTTTQSLCIEATAGSGKTTLMVDRLVHLLVKEKVPPDRCLAITFTEKAAKEMLDRLIHKLSVDHPNSAWLDRVRSMPIGTIHAFCNGQLRKHGLLIDQSPNFRILHSIEHMHQLQQIINDIRDTYHMNPPEWLITCQQTWSVDQFNDILIKAYFNRDTMMHWLTHEFYDIGDHEPNEFSAMYDTVCAAVRDACTVFFDRINASKIQDDWLDYDDILFKTYQLLANIDWLRHQYQDQISHIFVDEFQDTSPIQWKIISLLCSDTDPFDAQKLWIVGDRCQAIYGFRGADDQLMQLVLDTKHARLRHQKNALNYRSHPAIILFINELFQRLFNDQGETFLPMTPKKETNEAASIQCGLFNTVEDELISIETSVRSYIQQGIAPIDIAILVRKNTDAQRIKVHLDACQVACQINRGAGLCELDVIQVVICFLMGMLNADDDIAWFSIATDILNMPHGGHASVQLDPRVVEWQRTLYSGDMLDQLVQMVWTLPIKMSSRDETAVATFMATFKDYWTAASGRRCDILDWLTACISKPKTMGTQANIDANAVHIMTLHAAKGLEFSAVIVPFIDAPFNMGATDPLILSRHMGMGVSIPKYNAQNFIRTAIYTAEKTHAILEELRLFYVTLTRAKFHILLTGRELKRKNTSRLSLCLPYLTHDNNTYLFNFLDKHRISGLNYATRPIQMKHDAMALYTPAVSPSVSVWSVSNALDAMACPKKMMLNKFRPLDIIPSTPQLDGVTMHEAISTALIQKRQPTPKDPPWLAKLMRRPWYQRIISSGQLSIEKPFEYHNNGIIIRGRFDAVWFCHSTKTFEIFEFKRSVCQDEERYQLQVHFYSEILKAMHTHYLFNAEGSGIIDLKTGEYHALHPAKHTIETAIAILSSTTFSTQPLSCKHCPYHSVIPECSLNPF
jgi:ATP-dependent exoDNAse (exonuclease V) beta subunit